MEPTTDTTTVFTKNGDVPPPPAAPLPPLPPVPPLLPFGAEPLLAAPAASRPRFRLYRSRTDRMLGGVCGGLAEALGTDAALIRIGLVALTVLGAGSGVVLYVAAWMLAPEADAA